MSEINREKFYELLMLPNTLGMHAVGRALIAINQRQTDTEQVTATTVTNNGMGFTGADAFMGTRTAIHYYHKKFLSVKQLAYWRKPNRNGQPRICKYIGQLIIVAKAKLEREAA